MAHGVVAGTHGWFCLSFGEMSLRLALLFVALAACGDRDAPAGSGSAPPTNAPAPAPVPDRVGAGPALAVIDAPPPAADAAAIAAFDDERRDTAWAKAQESGLRAQLKDLPQVARVEVECRTSQCKVTLGATPGHAAAAAGELEAALRGQASAIVFGATGPGPDDVVVYVQLAR
jgi:hypothetical protein